MNEAKGRLRLMNVREQIPYAWRKVAELFSEPSVKRRAALFRVKRPA
jgi:hypothetical protein